MTIKDNYHRVRQQAAADESVVLGAQAKAVKAIHGGHNSAEWREFMQIFASGPNSPNGPYDPRQLAKLVGTNGYSEDGGLALARSYLIADAITGLDKGPGIDDAYLDLLDNIPGIEPPTQWP